MLEMEYINKFVNIVSFYNIDKSYMYDIARAISYSESFDTHPISLSSLSNSGVDYFNGITDVSKSKDLSDVRVMRMMCDTLLVALFTTHSSLFSSTKYLDIVKLISKNVGVVLSEAKKYTTKDSNIEVKLDSTDHYKTIDECKKVLDLLYEIIDKKSNNSNELAKFLNFLSDCPVKANFDGLVIDELYRDDFSGVYFIDNISFRNTKEAVLDSLTNYMIDSILKSKDILCESLLISTKARRLGLSSKAILKVTPDKYKNLRSNSFVMNALNTIFTFTHANSIQNVDSLIILYALINFESNNISEVKKYLGGR